MTTEPAALTPDQSRRAAQFAPQVEILARQVGRMLPSIPFSDLVGVGNEALVLAAGRYDPEMGTQFSTFVHYRVRGAMLDFARRRNPARRQNSRALKLLEATQSILEQAHESSAGERASLEQRVAAAKALVEKTGAAAFLAASTPVDPELVPGAHSVEMSAILTEKRDSLRDAAWSRAATSDHRRLQRARLVDNL